jgi:hypothetical protein
VPPSSATLAVLLSVGLAACGSSSDGSSGATTPVASATTPAPTDSGSAASSTPTSSAAPAGSVPSPSGDQLKQMLYILKAIDPGMGTDDAHLVSASLKLCGVILSGAPQAQIDNVAASAFANGSYKPQGEELQAVELTMTQTFCS